MLDRLIPASHSRRRDLRLSRSRHEHAPSAADSGSWIREAETIAAQEWLTDAASWIREAEAIAARASLIDTPSWIREAEATAEREWLAHGRTA